VAFLAVRFDTDAAQADRWSDALIDAGALSVKVVVRFSGLDIGSEAREALARWALDHCPVTDSVARPVPIELEVA